MDLMELIEKRKKEINQEIEKAFPKKPEKWLSKSIQKPKYSIDLIAINKGLSKQVWEFLDRGGKRWRPALMISACKALGGKERTAIHFTPLIELVHEGTLLVDDVEDNADIRRGKPAMHKIYGIDSAVNTGNAMYFIPLSILYQNKFKLSKEKIIQIYNLYSEEMLRLSIGQALDIEWHKGNYNVNEKQYFQMCAFKTGVLARMAAKIGAILAGASEKKVTAVGEFAEALGIAFQIQDDILNIAPKSNNWGKEVGEDISEGKRTLLVIRALKKLPEKEAIELTQILNSHSKNRKKITRAIALIKKTDAIAYSEKKAKKIVSQAWQKIEIMLPENQGKQELKAFADFAVNRKI